MWPQRRNSGDGGGWNPQRSPSFSHPPSLFSLPPPPPFTGRSSGGAAWSSAGPRPPFRGPPPSFSGPPRHGLPPSFSSPPPHFSGPPPSFRNNQPSQSSASGSWNSYPSSCPSDPWSSSGDGCKRQVNNVWSDPNLLSPSQRTGFENRNGHPHHQNRGRGRGRGGGRGGGGGRGRGRGRGGHQFQQEHNNNRNGGNFVDNKNKDGSNNNSGGKKKKKEKVDKRDLPENNQYHCEVCDRGFKTEEKYEEHVSQHTQCSVAGCPYVAAPKLVQLHYYAQHKTGVANKIWSLDTPESIKKWIEDRKRNFPTQENKARKEKEREERAARGEMIENKQFGKMRGRGRDGRGHHRGGRGQNSRGGHRRWEQFDGSGQQDDYEEKLSHRDRPSHPEDGPQKEDSSSLRTDRVNGKGGHSQENAATGEPKAKKRKLDEDEERDTLKGKDGVSRDPLSLLISGDGDSDSDDSNSEDRESTDNSSPTKLRGDGLSSLMASYDDSAKEDEELTDKEEASAEVEPKTSNDSTAREEKGMLNETPDDVDTSEVRTIEEEPAWIRHNKRRRNQKYRRNTLLERLLANEIRHERNVLLQCVHYIVKNNFLGVLDRKTEAVEK